MPDLQWDMLTNSSANLGNALTNAAGQVRQHRETATTRNALTNYLANPNDQAAFQGYAARNPTGAFQLRDEQRQAIQQLNTTQQAHLRQAGELLRDVRDDAGYQRALQAGHMAGIDVAGAPPTYDPNFVEQVRVAARAVAPPTEQHPTNIQREIEYYRSIGRNDLAQQLMENHAEGAPVLFDVTGDGVPDLVPRSYVRQQGGASPAPQVTPQSSPQGDPDVMVNPQTGQMIRFNRQTNQWEPIQGATPTVSSDLQNWRGAGSGPQGFR